jgi:lipid-binding SYLF domain-containing protein
MDSNEQCAKYDEKGRMKMRLITATLLAGTFAGTTLAAQEDVERLKASGEVLQEIMATPDKGIPRNLFHKAYCVVVIPSMLKAGFIFSAKYGRGYASCRKQGGGWAGPAAMRVEGGGFGLQIGGSATDIVMLVMSKKGMNGMLSSKFTLGGEASAAAGPVGRDVTAQTDATMRADILSWSRSRGIFGGISVQGGTLRQDTDVNKALYRKNVGNREILTGKVEAPASAEAFTAKLVKYGGAEERK